MKRLTLDQTWKYCMSMWRWIYRRKKAGDENTIDKLKVTWLKNHGFGEIDIDHDCFFCEYDEQKKKNRCTKCPARLIESCFHCNERGLSYWKAPIAFYNKLRSLNRKRLAGKKGKVKK